MSSGHCYIGCGSGVDKLRAVTDKLNAQVVEQVNESQELLMLNNFSRETNESHFKRCLQDRIADISSWCWVLEDLTKRLQEAISNLQYEHNALHVVVKRIKNEIEGPQESIKAGTFGPLTDAVEESIMQELHFLRDQKKKFENMIPILEKQIYILEKTKKKIEADIVLKNQALAVEEACANISLRSCSNSDVGKKKKKRGSPVSRWENRCAFLKRSGLRALANSLVTRQQVRGARVYLSIAAQAYATRVDSALRRRMHSNKIKLQDLNWQKEEALRDYKSLAEELTATEQNLLETMEQERLVEARLADRALRPAKELTKDEVDRKLKDELGRLKSFSRQLRTNLERITSLQNHLTDSISRINCFTTDLIQVINLDEDRLRTRLGDVECDCIVKPPPIPASVTPALGHTSSSQIPASDTPALDHTSSSQTIFANNQRELSDSLLTAIKEEDEEKES